MYRYLILALLVSACTRGESIATFAEKGAEYVLVELDGMPFVERATISFPQIGQVAGQGPCNRYFAQQTVPYPWFGLEGIGATRMACPDLPAEAAFLATLEDMTLAQITGQTLTLSNSNGRRMVFEAR